jgi:hypothetical protein
MWAKPLAPPPLKTKPILGRFIVSWAWEKEVVNNNNSTKIPKRLIEKKELRRVLIVFK